MCLLQREGQRDMRFKVAQKSVGFHCQTKEWMEAPKCEWACTVVPSGGGADRTKIQTYRTSFLGIFTWGLGALTLGGGHPPQACVLKGRTYLMLGTSSESFWLEVHAMAVTGCKVRGVEWLSLGNSWEASKYLWRVSVIICLKYFPRKMTLASACLGMDMGEVWMDVCY